MSMTFYATKTTSTGHSWVFTDSEMTAGDYVESGSYEADDYDVSFVPNPGYVPEADLCLSNANATWVISALGYTVQDGMWRAPAAEVASRCTHWLRSNLGNPSPGIDAVEEHGSGGMLMVQCAVPAGYLNDKIHRLSVLAHLALQRGADTISAC